MLLNPIALQIPVATASAGGFHIDAFLHGIGLIKFPVTATGEPTEKLLTIDIFLICLQKRLKGLKPNRYEGWLVGGGIGIGYEYALAKHWNLGADLGVGYTYIDYKKYDCEVCGTLKDNDDYHYVGISKLGLSLIYVF